MLRASNGDLPRTCQVHYAPEMAAAENMTGPPLPRKGMSHTPDGVGVGYDLSIASGYTKGCAHGCHSCDLVSSSHVGGSRKLHVKPHSKSTLNHNSLHVAGPSVLGNVSLSEAVLLWYARGVAVTKVSFSIGLQPRVRVCIIIQKHFRTKSIKLE